MKIPYYTVDAFTSEPFAGNPAAVCLLEQNLEDALKQSIAREMNISETCFIEKVGIQQKIFREASVSLPVKPFQLVIFRKLVIVLKAHHCLV